MLTELIFDKLRMYDILPYAKYGSLEECLMNPGFVLREDTLCDYLKQILRACGYLKSLRLSHGDLKVGNFLSFEDGMRLTDFGCTVWHSNKREAKYLSGTHLAPEIMAKSKYCNTKLADVYALSVSMVRLCGKCIGELDLDFDPDILWTSVHHHSIEWKQLKRSVKELIHGLMEIRISSTSTITFIVYFSLFLEQHDLSKK